MSVKTRAQLKDENAADFPNNNTGLISPAGLRGQMDDIADSMFLAEDLDTPGGPASSGGGGGSEGGSASVFESQAAAAAASISDSNDVIETLGYWTGGDGGRARYKRVVSEPSWPGKFQSADGEWWEIAEHEFNVRAFGAKGDGVTDDAAAIQAAIDRALLLQNTTGKGSFKVLLPPGRYSISVPLEIFNYAAPSFNNVSIHLCSESRGYVAAKRTELLPTFNDLPAIFIQKARNVRISGFSIRGKANDLLGATYRQLLNDEVSPWWNTLGARDNPYSPHCGIAIDAFHVSLPTGADRYPGYESYYTSSTGAGGTSIMIDHMEIQGFIVGIGNTLSGTQIGDSTIIEHCDLSYNKVCVVNGQSQNRGLLVHNNHVKYCQVYVDSTRYGQGLAPLGTISGGVVVFCKWLIMGNPTIDSATIRDLYVESIWSLGVWGWANAGHSLLIERCHIKFIDSKNNDNVPMEAVDVHFHNTSPVAFYGGYIGFNNNS